MRSLLDRLAARAGLLAAPGPPTQVHLSVTDRCFLPCIHCNIHRNRAVDLPTPFWLSVLDDLARWLGTASVNFVGGEPLLRRDLETLMARAHGRGLTVSFNTNGWLLTRARAERLHEAGASIAYLSLDGTEETLVDWTRGRKGAWRRAMEAMEHLEAVGRPRVIVATILHGRNAPQIPHLLEMVRQRGHQLVVQPLFESFGAVPPDPRWHHRSPLWPRDPEVMDEALDLLLAVRRAGGPVCNPEAQLTALKAYFRDPVSYNGLTCRAGMTDLAIDPQGQVRLCFNLPPVADAREKDLERVWNGPASLRLRGRISRCRRTCNLLNCNFA